MTHYRQSYVDIRLQELLDANLDRDLDDILVERAFPEEQSIAVEVEWSITAISGRDHLIFAVLVEFL